MIKSLRIRLYPNQSQRILIEKHFGATRFVWNHFLQARTEFYAESKGKGKPQGLNYFKTCKLLTELKKEKPWLHEISSASLQQSLRKLDNAFTAFFRKNNDYPKFRSKKGNQYFVAPTKVNIRDNRLVLLKFSKGIKFKDKHDMPTKIKQAIITRDVDRYYASIFYESKEQPTHGNWQIGIDVGIEAFATLSNGIQIQNPHHIHTVEKRIKRQQKKLSRKIKGSHNRRKQARRIAKLYQELRDKRTDFLHKASTAIAKQSDVVVMETLNVAGMSRNHKLAKSISDASWSRFKEMIRYKSEWRKSTFIEIGQFEASSKICSRCGWRDANMKLSQRMFDCQRCGLKLNRDLNAAINILRIGTIKVGKGIPEFTPVESAPAAELFAKGGLRVVTR